MFVARLSEPITRLLWVGWLLAALALTLGPLAWHVEFFARIDPRTPTLLVIALVLTAVGALAYAHLRRDRIYRWEPVGMAAAALGAGLAYEPAATAVVLGLALTAYAAGRLLREKLGLKGASAAGGLGVDLAVGFAALGFVWLALAATGRFGPVAVLLVSGGTLALLWRRAAALAEALRSLQSGWRGAGELRETAVGAAVFYGFSFLLYGLASALAPAIQSDALRQHLTDASRILRTGGLYSSGAEWFSYFPKGMELWLAAAQALGGTAAAQLVNPILFGAALLLVYAIARQCGVGRSAAVLGTMLAATTPFVHWTGVVIKNDFLYALYHLAALYAWLRAREENDDRWLLLGTFLLAASLGVKHTAVFGVVPLSAMYLWRVRRKPRWIATMAAITLVFGSYWYVRAYLEAGNPVFPFGSPVAGEKYQVQENFLEPQLVWLETWREYATYPWVAQFQGERMFESPTENPVGAFLALFVVAWLLVRRREADPNERAVLLFLVAFYFVWGYVWGMLRYGLAAYMIFVVLTAARLQPLLHAKQSWMRHGAMAGLLYSFVFATPPTLMMEVNAPQLSYLAGLRDREDYLRAAVSGYAVMRRLAEDWTPESLALSASNVAMVYSPDSTRVHYASENEPFIPTAANFLARYEYDYLIYPNAEAERFVSQLGPEGAFEEIYHDEAFTLAKRRTVNRVP